MYLTKARKAICRMLIKKGHIVTFVDCMPSEQGGLADDDVLCVVSCAVFGVVDKLVEIKQYKDCTKKQREIFSQIIIDSILSSDVHLDIRSTVTRVSDAEKIGTEILSTALGIKIEVLRELKKLTISSMPLNLRRAKMYSWYALALSVLSTHLSSMMRRTNCQRGTMLIDNLPGDDPNGAITSGIECLKFITDRTPLMKLMWLEAREDSMGSEMGFAYSEMSPEIGYNLADWLAQGLHAATNPETFRKNIRKKNERRRRQVADVFLTHLKKKHEDEGIDPEKAIFHIPYVAGFCDQEKNDNFRRMIKELAENSILIR